MVFCCVVTGYRFSRLARHNKMLTCLSTSVQMAVMMWLITRQRSDEDHEVEFHVSKYLMACTSQQVAAVSDTSTSVKMDVMTWLITRQRSDDVEFYIINYLMTCHGTSAEKVP